MPHSDIHGSKPARGSPWLFAACHVLHRLLVPRHPPNALLTLDLGLSVTTLCRGDQSSHHAQEQPPDTHQPNPAGPFQAIEPIPSLLSTQFWRPARTSHPPDHPHLCPPDRHCLATDRSMTDSQGRRRQSLRAGHYTPPSVRTRFPSSPFTGGTDRISPERPTRSSTRRGAPEPDSQL